MLVVFFPLRSILSLSWSLLGGVRTGEIKVVARKNFGEYVNEYFSPMDKFDQVWFGIIGLISNNVSPALQALSKCVPAATRSLLSLVPNSNLDEFCLPLESFDISCQSKNGCGGMCPKSVFEY